MERGRETQQKTGLNLSWRLLMQGTFRPDTCRRAALLTIRSGTRFKHTYNTCIHTYIHTVARQFLRPRVDLRDTSHSTCLLAARPNPALHDLCMRSKTILRPPGAARCSPIHIRQRDLAGVRGEQAGEERGGLFFLPQALENLLRK